MDIFFNTINVLFGYIFYPFTDINPAWGMIWISLVTGIVMLIIFRIASNQDGIRKAKAKVGAYILEMRLYNHNLLKMLAALGKTLIANVFYLRYMVVPILFIVVPVLLVLIQVSYRYENRPLRPGEQVIVKAVLKSGFSMTNFPVILQAPEGIVVETPALRIASLGEVDWRLHGEREGEYDLTFSVDGKKYRKDLYVINNRLTALGAKRVGSSFYSLLLNHYEPELADSSPFISLNIMYPDRVLKIIGFEFHWIIWFFILSLVFSFAFKGIFHVEL